MEPQIVASSNGHGLDAAREQQLRLLLSRLEAGGIDAYEYAQRVQALEAATTVEAMAAIVDAAPKGRALDAVDLALMARSAVSPADNKRRRAVLMAAMAMFLVVLMALGLWLVSRAHAVSGSGALGRPAAAQLSADPPSGLSSLR